MVVDDSFKKEFIDKYTKVGEQKFYNFLLTYALNKLISIEKGSYTGESPELEFLEYHDRFIILYRRDGESISLELARIFRRVAHKLYRVLLKKNKTTKNLKFLNMV